MRQISYHHVSQAGLRLVGHLTLTYMLVMGLELMPLGSATLRAGEQPSEGWHHFVWAVHESIPTFDMHFDTSYILAHPVAPLYNGQVTQYLYNAEKIIGDLAERWEIADDDKCITVFLYKGLKFHHGAPFPCADAQYSHG